MGWKKHKLESRLLGEISIISDMQIIPPLWQKVKIFAPGIYKKDYRGQETGKSIALVPVGWQ